MKHINVDKDNYTKNKMLTNVINPFKIDMKNIQHKYDLHIGVGIKFQSRDR